LLAALWFVPSANATVETPEQSTRDQARAQPRDELRNQAPATARQASHTDAGDGDGAVAVAVSSGSGSADEHLALADTGSFDTTPYLVGGTAFLGIGAGFVTYSVRRRGAGGGTLA
jgi:hypothetical protein